jgi:hypothetical protein
MDSRKLPQNVEQEGKAPSHTIPEMTISITIGRTHIDANLLSWFNGRLSEALLAARKGTHHAGDDNADQRKRLDAMVEEAITLLDTIDGDADLEDGDPDLEDGHDAEDLEAGPFRGGSERLAY